MSPSCEMRFHGHNLATGRPQWRCVVCGRIAPEDESDAKPTQLNPCVGEWEEE